MAQKQFVVLVNDITGEDMDHDEAETVEFGLDGVDFSIDLYLDQAVELREALARYVAAGRRTGGRAKRGTASKTVGGSYNRETSQAQRTWAREQGYEVSDRGRLPGHIVEAWEKAHQGSAA